MTVKRFTLFTLIGAMIAELVFAVSAQGDNDRGFKRGMFGFDGGSNPILEATGLDEAAVYAALKDGSTLAELIEANGGDVDSVAAAMIAQATAEINARVEAGQVSQARADAMLGMIEVEITEGIHNSFDDFADGKGRRGRPGLPMPRGEFGFDGGSDPILEATGLDEAAVYAALKDGSTLAELIEANGGDVDSVAAAMVAQATAEINARADAMLGMIEAEITEGIHSSFDDFADGKGRRGRPGLPMPRGEFGFDGDSNPILEATGLDEAALWEALKSGSTLAELIEANGGDVDSVVAAMVAQATAEITEGIHSSFDDFDMGKGPHGYRGFGFGDIDADADMDDEDSSSG